VSGEILIVMEGHEDAVRSVCFNPEGTKVVSAANDESVRLWDVKSGQLLHTYRGHVLEVQSVDISPDGKIIASGSDDRKIKLWGMR
jgi:WD40 repeat protein